MLYYSTFEIIGYILKAIAIIFVIMIISCMFLEDSEKIRNIEEVRLATHRSYKYPNIHRISQITNDNDCMDDDDDWMDDDD